jgi:hypothetical protein
MNSCTGNIPHLRHEFSWLAQSNDTIPNPAASSGENHPASERTRWRAARGVISVQKKKVACDSMLGGNVPETLSAYETMHRKCVSAVHGQVSGQGCDWSTSQSSSQQPHPSSGAHHSATMQLAQQSRPRAITASRMHTRAVLCETRAEGAPL